MPALLFEETRNIADLLYLKVKKKETRERASCGWCRKPTPSHQIQLYSSTVITETIAFLDFNLAGRLHFPKSAVLPVRRSEPSLFTAGTPSITTTSGSIFCE